MRFHNKALICTTCFLALNWVCKTLNGHFDINDLVKPKERGSAWDVSSKETSFDHQSVLKQKFHFLAKGHQAFAFVSDDGKYILKLFKPAYPRPCILGVPIDFSFFPFSKVLYQFFSKEIFQKRINKDLTSYANAFNKFKEESLLEYAHLTNTSDLKTDIKFFDKIGILRTLEADSTCFIIQKRAISLENTLTALLQENKVNEAKLILKRLFRLISLRKELGFKKATNKFHANFGCVGLQPVQYDVGKLLTAEDFGLSQEEADSLVDLSVPKLTIWLHKNYPSLSEYLEELKTTASL